MVYRHRTQKGKYINFRNKSSFENWKRGMFANMNSNRSVGRKVAKAKSKSRKRMQHRGVKDIKSGKPFCKDCKRKNVKLQDERCKLCENAFKEFKQPPVKDKIEAIGEKMDVNWDLYVDQHWESLKRLMEDIEPVDDDEDGLHDSVYMFITIRKDNQEVDVDDVSLPDYWHGASHSEYWVAQLPVDKLTNKQDLFDFDLSNESHYWEDILNDPTGIAFGGVGDE